MESLKVYFITWNVMGRHPVTDLNSLLNLTEPVDVVQLPDVYAIGLQEVSVKPYDLLVDAIFDDPWLTNFRNILAEYDYIKIKQMRLQGIMLLLFSKKEHLTHLRGIQTDYTRTGFGGMWGNKGGVTVRFKAYACSICIVNSHLAASDSELDQRISDYNTIIDKQKFVDSQTENILTHDYVFWIGDLNFRIDDLTTEEIMYLIHIKSFPPLLSKDQLGLVQKMGKAFSEFKESTPEFPPTYKFVVDSDSYASDKRKPAWTDRILHRYTRNAYPHTELEIKQIHYSSHVNYSQSDHKPVSALFSIKVFPDPQEKQVTFLPVKNWKLYEDGEAIYYFNDGAEPTGWDWIGLYKVDFTGLDEHINYVWASTRPITCESHVEKEKVEEVVHRTVRHIPPDEIASPPPPPSRSGEGNSGEKGSKHCNERGCKVKTPLIGNLPYIRNRAFSLHQVQYRIRFVDQIPPPPGTYQLLYIGSEFNDVLGISPSFDVVSN